MATSQSTTEFILDQLSSVPNVRVRKMFGEYALYCGDKVVGLICDDQLFVKTTPAATSTRTPGYQSRSSSRFFCSLASRS